MPNLEPIWVQATSRIHAILWGDQDERRRAKDELDRINDRIERRLKYVRLGTIETENWYKANSLCFNWISGFGPRTLRLRLVTVNPLGLIGLLLTCASTYCVE
ncbi:uncharacterized protein BDV17DRAFT_277688 [Aspergillus undulatus]|uniref:uncharacterized protein n=1 Tax=Aspergillus undulatus TaxID=1810928 RepID=UPI003CCD8FEC